MRVTNWIFILPLMILGVVAALANRAPVRLSLDPFSAENPAIVFDVPLWFVIFGCVLLGVVLGGLGVWFGQSRFRREARHQRRRAARLERELLVRPASQTALTQTAPD